MSKTSLKICVVVVYGVLGLFAAAYLAAAIYFLINKTIPNGIDMGTWLRYWASFGHDSLQRPRLLSSAVAALLLVYIAPPLAIVKLRHARRSLHGDARWANEQEIRKAGLL
jgi:type IV secretion system protein VirD4